MTEHDPLDKWLNHYRVAPPSAALERRVMTGFPAPRTSRTSPDMPRWATIAALTAFLAGAGASYAQAALTGADLSASAMLAYAAAAPDDWIGNALEMDDDQ